MKSAHLQRPHYEVLERLYAAGERGISSRYSSLRRKYIQLPTRVFELREFGFKIDSIPARKRSVLYVHIKSPKWYVPRKKQSITAYIFGKAVKIFGNQEG